MARKDTTYIDRLEQTYRWHLEMANAQLGAALVGMVRGMPNVTIGEGIRALMTKRALIAMSRQDDPTLILDIPADFRELSI